MQSESDLLRQENARLMTRITELEQNQTEIDKLTAKISELEHAKEENVELKAEVAKLRRDFEKLKRQTQAIANAQDTPSIGNIPEQKSHEKSNTSICTETKSLEDKEVNEFLESEHKRSVSIMMRDRNREKKLQDQVALTTSRDTPSIESEQTPIYQNENQSISEAPINQSQSAISSKIKIPYNQRIEQGLIQEAILFIQKGVLTSPINNLKTQESDVNIGNDKGGRELAQLFSDAEIAEGKMVEAKQKEIICWYTYREAYQNSVAEIQSKTGIAEKTAKTQVYIMIKASLPKVSDVNLYKKTQRAGTIYKLFGKIIDPITQKEVKGIGIDKAYGISYGAKSISELTNVQILNIIKQVTEKSHDILTNGQDRTKPFGSNDLAETKVSEEAKLRVSDSSSSDTKTNVGIPLISKPKDPKNDRTYFCNKILEQYPDLYREFSSEGVEGRYETGSYYIKCEQREIEITA
ncbi:14983_t:CDS:2 [Entrophospora sp. SA101]|nr:14983_t:CDS:2 [Entrophospora sp. SA101]